MHPMLEHLLISLRTLVAPLPQKPKNWRVGLTGQDMHVGRGHGIIEARKLECPSSDPKAIKKRSKSSATTRTRKIVRPRVSRRIRVGIRIRRSIRTIMRIQFVPMFLALTLQKK